jgi:hypothetical protein
MLPLSTFDLISNSSVNPKGSTSPVLHPIGWRDHPFRPFWVGKGFKLSNRTKADLKPNCDRNWSQVLTVLLASTNRTSNQNTTELSPNDNPSLIEQKTETVPYVQLGSSFFNPRGPLQSHIYLRGC